MAERNVLEILREAGADSVTSDSPAELLVEVVSNVVGELNGAPPLTRATVRTALVRDRGFPAKMVDAALTRRSDRAEPDLQGSDLMLTDPDPWPEPVDGSELLDELEQAFRRYVALPEGAAAVLSLWTVLSHAYEAFDVSPVLAITSPEPRCGKTTTLGVLDAVVRRPLMAANITNAVLFRAVEACRPTLLLDEADALIEGRDELRGLLNSGHIRTSACVLRAVGDQHEIRKFSTWAPKAVALVGRLTGRWSTLADRSIEVRMRRRKRGEKVERLQLAKIGAELEPTSRRASRWAEDHGDELRTLDPSVPGSLNDRAADNWRPLLAIATAAGGDWPEKARRAAEILAAATDDETAGEAVRLLEDLRSMFGNRDRLRTKEILRELHLLDERPWAEWKHGKPLSAMALAKLLRGFDVRPRTIKLPDGSTAKGYLRDAFDDAFERYLPPVGPTEPSPRNDAHLSAMTRSFADVTTDRDVTATQAETSAELWDGYAVTATPEDSEEDGSYEAAEREGMRDG